MKKIVLCLIVLLITGLASAESKDAAAALDKLRALNGDWEGTFTWSGARTATGKMGAQYYATGNGSAVVENLISDGVPTMTSVYHLDGADLRVTHFCGAQNQPRLKASAIDTENGRITFSFVDITNLRSPDAGHVEGLDVRLLAQDHITVTFHFKAGGKQSDELIDLRRKK